MGTFARVLSTAAWMRARSSGYANSPVTSAPNEYTSTLRAIAASTPLALRAHWGVLKDHLVGCSKMQAATVPTHLVHVHLLPPFDLTSSTASKTACKGLLYQHLAANAARVPDNRLITIVCRDPGSSQICVQN